MNLLLLNTKCLQVARIGIHSRHILQMQKLSKAWLLGQCSQQQLDVSHTSRLILSLMQHLQRLPEGRYLLCHQPGADAVCCYQAAQPEHRVDVVSLGKQILTGGLLCQDSCTSALQQQSGNNQQCLQQEPSQSKLLVTDSLLLRCACASGFTEQEALNFLASGRRKERSVASGTDDRTLDKQWHPCPLQEKGLKSVDEYHCSSKYASEMQRPGRKLLMCMSCCSGTVTQTDKQLLLLFCDSFF